jgi:hypothetical protein
MSDIFIMKVIREQDAIYILSHFCLFEIFYLSLSAGTGSEL